MCENAIEVNWANLTGPQFRVTIKMLTMDRRHPHHRHNQFVGFQL